MKQVFIIAQIDSDNNQVLLPTEYKSYGEAETVITYDLPDGIYKIEKYFIKNVPNGA